MTCDCPPEYSLPDEGQPTPGGWPKAPIDRFMAKVSVDSNGCWIWTGSCNWGGYGQFTVRKARHTAHRWSYEHHIGPIPEGLVIDHLCRVRACVNPSHLEPVTQRVNLERGPTLMAQTHCKRGHEYNEENTRTYPIAGGRWMTRECKVCHRAADRRRRREAKGKKAAEATFPAEMRPTKHAYQPDPLNHGVTCLECGEPRDPLHPEPAYDGPPPVDLEPVYCDCGHPPHDGPCRYSRTLYVTVQHGAMKQVCGCEVAA